MNMFYCSKCKKYDDDLNNIFPTEHDKRNNYVMPNLRDGYGRPIRHFKCPDCGNLLAGSIIKVGDNEDEVDYFKSVIDFYYRNYEVEIAYKDEEVYINNGDEVIKEIRPCKVYKVKGI